MLWGFPGGAVVGNPPARAGDTGSSPGPGGSHIPRSGEARAPQLLSPRATTAEARAPGAHGPQQEKLPHEGPSRRNEGWPPLAATGQKPACSNRDPTQPKINKKINK